MGQPVKIELTRVGLFVKMVNAVVSLPFTLSCCYIESWCCGLQIRPVEEQLKQRVIGKRYCISRKRKSHNGSTNRARLAVRLSNVS